MMVSDGVFRLTCGSGMSAGGMRGEFCAAWMQLLQWLGLFSWDSHDKHLSCELQVGGVSPSQVPGPPCGAGS